MFNFQKVVMTNALASLGIYVCLSAWRFVAGLGQNRFSVLRKSSELRPTMHIFIRDNTVYFLVYVSCLRWVIVSDYRDIVSILGQNFPDMTSR